MWRPAGQCEMRVPAAEVLQRAFGNAEPLLLAETNRFSGEFQVGEQTVQLRADLLPMNDGPPGRILVLTDVTDRKLADYALRTAEKLAAAGNLAQALAHEINNPLEAVMNLVYLAQTATQGDVHDYLNAA